MVADGHGQRGLPIVMARAARLDLSVMATRDTITEPIQNDVERRRHANESMPVEKTALIEFVCPAFLFVGWTTAASRSERHAGVLRRVPNRIADGVH